MTWVKDLPAKTFVATWRPVGGMIRVVLLDEPDGAVAFFCTDPNATVAEIRAVAERLLALAAREYTQSRKVQSPTGRACIQVSWAWQDCISAQAV